MGAPIQTYKPLILHHQTTPPPTPWQAFKMALVVPSFNTPVYTRYSYPQVLGQVLGLVMFLKDPFVIYYCVPHRYEEVLSYNPCRHLHLPRTIVLLIVQYK